MLSEKKLGILEKTGSADVRELVDEVRDLRSVLREIRQYAHDERLVAIRVVVKDAMRGREC